MGMRASIVDVLRERVSRLAAGPEARRAAQEAAAAAGLPGSDAAERLRREWLNDLVSDPDGAERERASAQPDRHFLEWVRQRVREPFHVSYRAVAKVGRGYGDEIAIRLVRISWPQEIAWAQRLRADENPRIAVLSALFLREAMSDPSQVFLKLADAYAQTVVQDQNYLASPNHELSPEEIRGGDGDPFWTPLFLHYAARAYASVLNSMGRQRLEGLAARARRDEERDLRWIAVARIVEKLRAAPLSRSLGVICTAIESGLGSNDLIDLERRFLIAIEDDRIRLDPDGAPPYRLLIDFIRRNRRNVGDVAEPPSGEEAALRVARVDALGKRWLDALPGDYRPLGARRKERFEDWKAQVILGDRPAPVDPIVDYGFFLVESNSSKATDNGRLVS